MILAERRERLPSSIAFTSHRHCFQIQRVDTMKLHQKFENHLLPRQRNSLSRRDFFRHFTAVSVHCDIVNGRNSQKPRRRCLFVRFVNLPTTKWPSANSFLTKLLITKDCSFFRPILNPFFSLTATAIPYYTKPIMYIVLGPLASQLFSRYDYANPGYNDP